MRTRSFLFGALPVLCGLFAAALFLPGCDSGADFSSLEAIAPNDGLTAKARAWYAEQVEFEVSDRLSKAEGDEDSLALLSFIEKFPPDWNDSVVLSIDGTEETLVLATTLGKYTDERYDSVMYHVRTLVMDMEPSGDVVSGHVIAFSSDEKLSKENFTDYVERYVAKDFAGMKITVSRYTIMFEDVDSYFYSPNKIPLELSTKILKKRIDINNFGKFNSIENSSTICYINCYVTYGRTCTYVASDPSSRTCGAYDIEVVCSSCMYVAGGEGGGGDIGGGGGGGGGNSDENNEDEEDNCACSSKHQCDLAKEHNSDLTNFTCSNFKNNHGIFVTNNKSTEYGKHGGYGYVHSDLKALYSEVKSSLISRGIYGTLNINSGYRCPEGNRLIKGRYTDSAHIHGRAADIQIYGDCRTGPWTEDMKNSIVEFNKRVRPGSYTYAGTRNCADDKTGHVHISNMLPR